MKALSPEFLIAVAGSFIGVREQGGENRGQMIDRFLASTGLRPGYPWCAAFVSYVGYWSHYDHLLKLSLWPLNRTASCWELGQEARARKILEKSPEPGDIFLMFNAGMNRFAHTGIVVDVLREELRPNGSEWYTCLTIEGNTNAAGAREGDIVARKERTFYPDAGDRFVRWVKLDGRGTAGNGDDGRRKDAA